MKRLFTWIRRKIFGKPNVCCPDRVPPQCYRCGPKSIASKTFMGLDYCEMCYRVVPVMYPAVQHDPPVGFPGGPPGDPNWAEK